MNSRWTQHHAGRFGCATRIASFAAMLLAIQPLPGHAVMIGLQRVSIDSTSAADRLSWTGSKWVAKDGQSIQFAHDRSGCAT